jgi:2'-5' RNA ligase
MPTHRYAVFGLLDDDATQAVRSTQQRLFGITGNDLALRFPVHVTLRGRFQADPEAVNRAWEQLCLRLHGPSRFRLSRPVFRPPDLLWLEVKPESPGHANLVRWHSELTRELEAVVTEDETQPAHTGEGYRPHVTLGWGVTGEVLALSGEIVPSASTAFVTAVVLAEYPSTWPASGVVLPTRQLRLAGEASGGETQGTSC